MAVEDHGSRRINLPEWVFLTAVGLAMALSIVAVVTSVNASAQTAREANRRAAASEASQTELRTALCGFTGAIAGFNAGSTAAPTTPAGQANRNQLQAGANEAAKTHAFLKCPNAATPPPN